MIVKRIRLLVACVLTSASMSQAQIATKQVTLAEIFDQLRSKDPKIVESAKNSIVEIAKRDLPNIEQDTDVLCNGLRDTDPYIRLQATAILSTIVRIVPEHAPVVTACTKNLLIAAADSERRVRNNALFALVMNPSGPPAGAHDLFIRTMTSDDLRTSQLGAAGLLRLGDDKTVINALKSTTDTQRQLNLLYAIGGLQVKSAPLFESVQKYAYSGNSEMQTAAVDALVAVSVDAAKTETSLISIANSRGVSSEAKLHASAALEQIRSH